jgi:hypothetical protein
MNFTRKCFANTCDFLLVTGSPEVVAGLRELFDADWEGSESGAPATWSERLIVSPENARQRITALLDSASRSIRVIDHKVEDGPITLLLETKRAQGVQVEVLGRGEVGDMISHGKMFLIDDRTAVLGSISLSKKSLDSRREVSVVVRDPACVSKLSNFYSMVRAEVERGPQENTEVLDVTHHFNDLLEFGAGERRLGRNQIRVMGNAQEIRITSGQYGLQRKIH